MKLYELIIEDPKLTKDQKNAIAGRGKYKPKPKPKANPNAGQMGKNYMGSTPASYPDPMGLSKFKGAMNR